MDLRRLRVGEWLAAVSGLALLASLFLPWYGPGSVTGWEALSAIDVLLPSWPPRASSSPSSPPRSPCRPCPSRCRRSSPWSASPGWCWCCCAHSISRTGPPVANGRLWLGLAGAIGIVAGSDAGHAPRVPAGRRAGGDRGESPRRAREHRAGHRADRRVHRRGAAADERGRHPGGEGALDPRDDLDDGALLLDPAPTRTCPTARRTVGFEVHVKHVAAAGEGSSCTVRARLNEVVSRTASCASRSRCARASATIGVGTHERRVVDQAGFGS